MPWVMLTSIIHITICYLLRTSHQKTTGINLRQLMMKEYIEVMKSEVPPEFSGQFQTEKEKLFIAEYGNLYDNDTPLDPLQRERREMLQKQACCTGKVRNQV